MQKSWRAGVAVLAVAVVGAAAQGAHAAPSAARPSVLSIRSAPIVVPGRGGWVTLTIRVRHATTCAFSGQRRQSGPFVAGRTVRCASGHATARLPVAASKLRVDSRINFKVVVRGPGGLTIATSVVDQAARATAPPPAPLPAPQPTGLTVSTPALPNAAVGGAYSRPLAAGGGTAPYSWSLAAGALPPGLALTADGVVSGTAATAGHYTFTVQVADAASTQASAPLSIDVVGPLSTGAEKSTNWSGYALNGGPFTYVTGTFTVPMLAPTSTVTRLGEWVGIDGANNNSLIQAGVAEDFDPLTNRPATYAWWEIIPAPETPIFTLAVSPGDKVTVTIAELASGPWSIQLVNDTNGQTFSITVPYSGPGESAEWVVEAPYSIVKDQVETLAHYTPSIVFTDLAVAGPATSWDDVTMFQSGTAVSTPSVLTAAGFAVAYGATAPPPPG